jgi:hypothetical protein
MEILRSAPRGTIDGPVKIPEGIPDGWIVCDGKNGTPDLSPSALANMAEVKKRIDKEFAYVMKE